MGFTEAIRAVFGKYATFEGRACRSEFWWFSLFTLLMQIPVGILDSVFVGGHGMMDMRAFTPFGTIWALATFLPSLAVAVRRLHDTDHSGWWWFLWLVPVIGWIVLFVWYVSKGTDGPNRFGPDPLGGQGGPWQPAGYAPTSIPRVPRDQ